MTVPNLTIAIPTFNRCQFLETTLRSIIPCCQDQSLFEIVVADNASTDSTSELLKRPEFSSLPNFRVLRQPENLGAEENIRSLIRHSRGCYVKLLNDNVAVRPTLLPRILEATKSNPAIILNVPSWRASAREVSTFDELIRTAWHWITWLGGITIRREAFPPPVLDSLPMGTLLLPMHLLLRAFEWNRHGIVLFGPEFEGAGQETKGGYDFGDIFIRNYFSALESLQLRGLLSTSTLRLAKLYHLFFFVHPWFFRTNILARDRVRFHRRNFLPVIFEKYGFNPLVFLLIHYSLIRIFWASWKQILTGERRRMRECF